MPPMKARDFLFAVEEAALAALSGPPPPGRRVIWTILQYHFGDPWLHYEIQPQVSRRRVEVGLHFESSVEQSERAALALASEAPWLPAALGDGWEIEEWTGQWRRLHAQIGFDSLGPDLIPVAARAFAGLIEATAPVLDRLGLVREPRAADAPTIGPRWRRRHRRHR